jgi:DNA-binding NtrC family response regulator
MSRLLGALVILVAVAGTAGAQSLADVARKEEARRKDVKKPSRVITNKDLKASDNVAPPAPAEGQAPAPAPADNADKTDDGQPKAEASDEQVWRQKMADARTALERSQMHLDALQNRIDGLWAQFTAHDNYVERERIEADRKKALAEYDRVKAEIEDQQEGDHRPRRAGAPRQRASRLAALVPPSRRPPAPILIVEDKDSLRAMLRHALEDQGHSVLEAADQAEALKQVRDGRPDLILSDLRLLSGDGVGVLRGAKEIDPGLPVIVMTAYGSIQDAVVAMKEGALDFLAKPVDPDHLLLLVERALAQRRMAAENQLLREEVAARRGAPAIIGDDPSLARVIATLHRAAATDTTVLLLGESGTGKELFARTLHAFSNRADGPFVAINCAAIPETLLETELFGHEKGAFTGANARKPGRFELAHRGTLFLDEIGDLPIGLQAKILRALEEKRFERVGGTQSLQVDVRVVAATNRNLKAAVAARQFREDLFFRLSVFPIDIPPLRERQGDIDILARYFVDRFCRELKKRLALSPEAIDELRRYNWPGNVRELQNCIERAVILADGDTIRPRHLNLSFARRGSAGAARGRRAGHLRHAGGCHASRRGRGRAAQDPAGARRGGRAEAPRGRPAAGELQDAAAEDQGLRDRALAQLQLPAARCQLHQSRPESHSFEGCASSSSVTSSAIAHCRCPVASTKCSRPSTTFLSRRAASTMSRAARSLIAGSGPSWRISAASASRSADGMRSRATARSAATSMPQATASPCRKRRYAVTASMAWPAVCP